jgi:hypothetical protein
MGSSLEKCIDNIGKEALELESGFSLFERLNWGQTSPRNVQETFEASADIALQFSHLLNGSCIRIPFAQDLMRSPDYPCYLALSLLDHGVGELGGTVGANASVMKSYSLSGKTDRLEGKLADEHLFMIYENLRIGLCCIPYIADGNPNWLADTDPVNFGRLVDDKVKFKFKDFPQMHFKVDFSTDRNFRFDDYWVLFEMMANTKNSFVRLRESCPNERLALEIRMGNSIYFKDNGTGICPGVLPLILYGFTEHGTGVGGPVVRRLAELKGGHVEVISTMQNRNTVRYDTVSNEVTRCEQQPRGTTFRLHF